MHIFQNHTWYFVYYHLASSVLNPEDSCQVELDEGKSDLTIILCDKLDNVLGTLCKLQLNRYLSILNTA